MYCSKAVTSSGTLWKTPRRSRFDGELTEEAFDHVQPGSAGRRKVEMEPRMFRQPLLHFGMFVCGVVIQDQMQVAVGRRLHLDELQKLQPLLMAMTILALSNERAVGDVEGRKQGRGPMAHIVMRHRAGTPFFERQSGLRAVERLDLAFLIAAQDQSVLRSV